MAPFPVSRPEGGLGSSAGASLRHPRSDSADLERRFASFQKTGMIMHMTSAATALRSAGLRVTKPRVAVLDVLEGLPHATVDDVAQQVRARLGTVSVQAVYDVLAAGTRVGLVRRIEVAGSPARFETRTGDNHHHMRLQVLWAHHRRGLCRRDGGPA